MTIEDYEILFFIVFSATCLAIIKNLCKKNRELIAEKIKMQEDYEDMSALYKHEIEIRDDAIEKHNFKVFYDIGKERKMDKERFDLPAYMIGVDNEGMVILTTFAGECPTGSLKMNREGTLILIQLLSASIGANITMNKIRQVSNE